MLGTVGVERVGAIFIQDWNKKASNVSGNLVVFCKPGPVLKCDRSSRTATWDAHSLVISKFFKERFSFCYQKKTKP